MYEGEKLERGIETVLQNNIAAALVAVAARWEDIADVTLPSVASWTCGYRSWILDLASSNFPYIVTIVNGQNPVGRVEFGAQDVIAQSSISIFITAATEANANTIIHRYIEAVIDILQANQVIEGHKLRHYEPKRRIIADSTKHLVNAPKGDYEKASDVDYMRLGVIEPEYELLS